MAYDLYRSLKYKIKWVETLQTAAKELLASELRKEAANDVIDYTDEDFMYDLWEQDEDDLFEASPALRQAFLEFVTDKAEELIGDASSRYMSAEQAFKYTMDRVDGKNNIAVCSLDDWQEASVSVLRQIVKKQTHVSQKQCPFPPGYD